MSKAYAYWQGKAMAGTGRRQGGYQGCKNYDRNDSLGTLYDPENGTASDEERHKADN